MDGNGRWAKKRGLPRKMGHAAGAETFRRIATYCKNIGVKYLTVYAFSTENWKRSADEVQAIMALFEKYLHEAIDEMERDYIRLKILGELGPISPELRALLERVRSGDRAETGIERMGLEYQLTASPVPGGGAVLLAFDVTESRRAEQLRREFTANVSHELKTPMTTISGFAEGILDLSLIHISEPRD